MHARCNNQPLSPRERGWGEGRGASRETRWRGNPRTVRARIPFLQSVQESWERVQPRTAAESHYPISSSNLLAVGDHYGALTPGCRWPCAGQGQ